MKKISSLPVFSPTQMEKNSTLPAVIRASPLIKFEEKIPASPCIRDLRVVVFELNTAICQDYCDFFPHGKLFGNLLDTFELK